MSSLKRIHSYSSDNWIRCAWFECGKDGYEMHKSVFHEHDRALPCDHHLSAHINFVFCSERHKQYYLHSHIDLWNLPKGHKSTL
jgi:uncharacterized protein YodC (DUF2158 family)